MGVVQRQGIKGSLWMYLGILLGFVNGILLFPKILGEEVYGFVQWLFAVALLLASLSSLGWRSGIVKFFPYYRDKAVKNSGFLGMSLLFSYISTFVFLVLIYFFDEEIYRQSGFEENDVFLNQYGWLMLVLVFLQVNFDIFSGYLTALFKPSITLFYKDFAARIITTVLIVAFYLHYIDLGAFLVLLVAKQGLLVFGLCVYIYKLGEWRLTFNWSSFPKKQLAEMWRYNVYSLTSSIGAQLINRVDTIMIPALLSWSDNGMYAIFYFISTVIIVPHESLRQIITPIISSHIKEDDYTAVQKVFTSSARIVFTIGTWVFIGIVANVKDALNIIDADYMEHSHIVLILSAAQLVYCFSGFNMAIVSLSDHYRWDMYFKMMGLVLNILLNYLFILRYGLVGAAFATVLSVIITNILYSYLLRKQYGLRSFSWHLLGVLLSAGVALLVTSMLPEWQVNIYVKIVINSIVVSVLFWGILLFFNFSPEIKIALLENSKRWVEKLKG